METNSLPAVPHDRPVAEQWLARSFQANARETSPEALQEKIQQAAIQQRWWDPVGLFKSTDFMRVVEQDWFDPGKPTHMQALLVEMKQQHRDLQGEALQSIGETLAQTLLSRANDAAQRRYILNSAGPELRRLMLQNLALRMEGVGERAEKTADELTYHHFTVLSDLLSSPDSATLRKDFRHAMATTAAQSAEGAEAAAALTSQLQARLGDAPWLASTAEDLQAFARQNAPQYTRETRDISRSLYHTIRGGRLARNRDPARRLLQKGFQAARAASALDAAGKQWTYAHLTAKVMSATEAALKDAPEYAGTESILRQTANNDYITRDVAQMLEVLRVHHERPESGSKITEADLTLLEDPNNYVGPLAAIRAQEAHTLRALERYLQDPAAADGQTSGPTRFEDARYEIETYAPFADPGETVPSTKISLFFYDTQTQNTVVVLNTGHAWMVRDSGSDGHLFKYAMGVSLNDDQQAFLIPRGHAVFARQAAWNRADSFLAATNLVSATLPVFAPMSKHVSAARAAAKKARTPLAANTTTQVTWGRDQKVTVIRIHGDNVGQETYELPRGNAGPLTLSPAEKRFLAQQGISNVSQIRGTSVKRVLVKPELTKPTPEHTRVNLQKDQGWKTLDVNKTIQSTTTRGPQDLVSQHVRSKLPSVPQPSSTSRVLPPSRESTLTPVPAKSPTELLTAVLSASKSDAASSVSTGEEANPTQPAAGSLASLEKPKKRSTNEEKKTQSEPSTPPPQPFSKQVENAFLNSNRNHHERFLLDMFYKAQKDVKVARALLDELYEYGKVIQLGQGATDFLPSNSNFPRQHARRFIEAIKLMSKVIGWDKFHNGKDLYFKATYSEPPPYSIVLQNPKGDKKEFNIPLSEATYQKARAFLHAESQNPKPSQNSWYSNAQKNGAKRLEEKILRKQKNLEAAQRKRDSPDTREKEPAVRGVEKLKRDITTLESAKKRLSALNLQLKNTKPPKGTEAEHHKAVQAWKQFVKEQRL